jgi:radical SAM protein with 4Fe4S-binding SPASM domain
MDKTFYNTFYPMFLWKIIYKLTFLIFLMMIYPFIKYFNAASVGYSYIYSLASRRPVVIGMPPAISVELTNICNLSCPECNTGAGLMTRKQGYMKVELFEKIISEIKPYLFNLNLYFQGESMLHPHFFSFLYKSKGIRTTVSTNGHFLSPENSEKIARSGLHNLMISLDGMDKASYEAYRRGGEYEKVINGIGNISEAIKMTSSQTKLTLQFLVNKQNEQQIHLARKFARRMNAILRLKSMQIINKGSYESWLPSLKQFSRYTKINNEYAIKSRLPDRCARLWFNPVITWEGKVIPCCFDKDAYHIMGDLNEESFREIWDGPKYRLFRKRVMSGRHMTDICTNCTEGLKGIRY